MENKTYSYHIFYFPFNWEIEGDKEKTLTEQTDLGRIPVAQPSMWQRVQIDDDTCITSDDTTEQEELFGERQYYFKFVHPVLYDIKGAENPLIHHYERREPQEGNVEYRIRLKKRDYILKVDAINLNLYSTGVGILSFYLRNDRKDQKGESNIRDINQYGRRIMPPHCGEFNPQWRNLLAQSISITGLGGDAAAYSDAFDYAKEKGSSLNRGFTNVWEPARFIKKLIKDLSPALTTTSVIDDRMIVNCWYANEDMSKEISINYTEFEKSDFWYKYIFVDSGDKEDDVTCQNEDMRKKLIEDSTYKRWQKSGTLYGISRYSLVALTDEKPFATNVISMHMRAIYSRMLELVIVQRASMLRFSDEVTKVSSLSEKSPQNVSERVSSLYKEYISFVNQIFFRNVTSQDQGIELYDMMTKQFDAENQIKDLDEEIGELHQYITLKIDQRRNENGEFLNLLAAFFLPATLLTGIFGMNPLFRSESLDSRDWAAELSIIAIVTIASIIYLIIRRKRGNK